MPAGGTACGSASAPTSRSTRCCLGDLLNDERCVVTSSNRQCVIWLALLQRIRTARTGRNRRSTPRAEPRRRRPVADQHRRRLLRPHADAVGQHAAIDLTVEAKGDLHVDQHHTVEDVGICSGPGGAAGARRQGRHSPLRPLHAADGRDAGHDGDRLERPVLPGVSSARFRRPRSATSTASWSKTSGKRWRPTRCATCTCCCTTAATAITSAKAIFKATARALRMAVELDPRMTGVPSTKGTLTD